MSILPPTPNNDETALTLAPEWLAGLENLSVVSPEVALRRPLAELVLTALTAAAGDSENTARAYQGGIALFLQFLGERLGDRLPPEWQPLAEPGKEGRKTVWEIRGAAGVLRAVSAGVLDDFTAWRAAEGDGKQTQALRRRAVSTFLRVAYREGVLTHEQAQNMGLKPYVKRERKDEKPVGRRLKPDEVRRLREVITLKARTDRKAARDRTILDLMLYGGLRRDEVAHLTSGNFKQDGGRWWLVITWAKGGKSRRLKVHDALYKSLAAWLEIADLAIGIGAEPLFFNLTKGGRSTGKMLNSSVIGRIVAEYGSLAGLAPAHGENQLSPHDLRRTCARNSYDNGATLLQVQTLLGHSDPKTTTRYIGSLENDDSTAVDFVKY